MALRLPTQMLNRLKYLMSHSAGILLLKMFEFKKNLSILYFGYVSNVILMVALCLGLYARWILSEDMVILVIAFLGVFVFAISCALIYYYSMEAVGLSLSRLWIGCLLGVMAFTEQERVKYETSEEVMDILLMTSICVRCFWNIVERIMRLKPIKAKLVNQYDMLEMVGMMIASLLCDKEFISISLLVIAFAMTLIAIRLKSFLGIVNLLVMIVISSAFYFPKILKITVNPFALSCFVGRIAFEPLMDLFFSGLTMLQRWQPFLSQPSIIRRLAIFCVVCLEATFYGFLAKQMPSHKEWYIVVPIFGAFSLVWWCYHIVFIITLWQLMNKISECNATYNSLSEENQKLTRIMASKGVRHFSLIAQRLTLVTLLTTIIIALIGWETKTAVSLSLLFMVLPIESCVMSMLWELGRVLGGTITGYALVAPVTYHRSSMGTTVLPTSAVQDVSNRATHILNTIQRFLSHHLVDTFGCDYSSSGLTAESVESKLKSFFQRVTGDGPRFDTYLVFYSGHVFDNGDWALAGDGMLKLDNLLDWWRYYHQESGARLILVFDTEHSNQWVRDILRLKDDFIAIQTLRTVKPRDPEEAGVMKIGDFTSDWMIYNCAPDPDINWRHPNRTNRAVYGISRCWADFTFHLPTEQDIETHWDSSFPKVTKPLIKMTNFIQMGSMCCCLDCVVKCLRRKRLLWFPPSELDTGHGFKLIRS